MCQFLKMPISSLGTPPPGCNDLTGTVYTDLYSPTQSHINKNVKLISGRKALFPKFLTGYFFLEIFDSHKKKLAMGLNFTIDITWGRLNLLRLGKKRPKN